MKYIIFVLTVFISVVSFAQDEILVKTDGTKYYIEVYDGVTNKKVLRYKGDSPGWQYKIFTTDIFTGSDDQLWSFEATEMFPGYFSIVNHELSNTHHLMSYNWFAYFTDADNRDPKTDKEMQFKVVEVIDGYYKLETIEKPTDGSLYGIFYTPGADALNVKPDGQVDFGDVKSDDITPGNMVNNVFRFVEFDPVALFESAIERGQELYDDNPDAPEKVRYDFFYILEKAREIRVFGKDADMLAYQPVLDEWIGNFNNTLSLMDLIEDARVFIDTTDVDQGVKNSFNNILDDTESFLFSQDLDYSLIDSKAEKINAAILLVLAIMEAETHLEPLAEIDEGLNTGLAVSIDAAKNALATSTSEAIDFHNAISHMERTLEIIDEIIIALDLIANTQEFEEAKLELGNAVDLALGIINTAGTTLAELDVALKDIQNAIKAFIRALEAGDTPVELINADFELDLDDWIVDSPNPEAAYPENKGVDGSRSITFWKGSDYQMKVYQSISNIPIGTYQISCFAHVNLDNSIGLFAKSGSNTELLPIAYEGDLTKRVIEITVEDGTLEFGIRGVGTDNAIPAGNWIVFDEFEVKWASKAPVKNPDFEADLTNWDVEGNTNAAYPENKGVDGSRSITCWSGSDYMISVSQYFPNIANGTYSVSAMAMTNQDSAFVVFGKSGGITESSPVTGNQLGKIKTFVKVTDGTLQFGVRGAGDNNMVPAGRWIVFDNVEVVRIPDIPILNPGFEQDLSDWIVDSPNPEAAYPENKGVDGSRSITFWKGSAYQMKVYQELDNIPNGTYQISCFAHVNLDNSIGLFAESGGNIEILPITNEGGLAKRTIEVRVLNGTLNFGIKGVPEDNSIPAGNWIVFDNFEVKIKTIVPEYEDGPGIVLSNDNEILKVTPEIKYWQNNQMLTIESTESIIKYAVYTINGTLVETRETNNKTLSIPLYQTGIFVVRILTENGFIDTEKVLFYK